MSISGNQSKPFLKMEESEHIYFSCVCYLSILISSGEALLKTDLKYFHREYDNTSNLGNKWNLIVRVYVVKNIINTASGGMKLMSSISPMNNVVGTVQCLLMVLTQLNTS
uniref:Putative ovule protein n=1 Tax=Solanum chacoense TaxID=4108 RepID=A0A0V0GSM5_SOLCH